MARDRAPGCRGAMEHAARGRPPGTGDGRGRAVVAGTSLPPRVLLDGLDPAAVSAAAAVIRLVGGEVVADVARGAARAGRGGPGGRPVLPPGRGASPGPGRVPDADPADWEGCVDLVLTGDPTRATPARSGTIPSIVVGERGTLRLPGDEALLADVVHAVALEQYRGRSSSVPSGEVVPDSGPEGSGRPGRGGRSVRDGRPHRHPGAGRLTGPGGHTGADRETGAGRQAGSEVAPGGERGGVGRGLVVAVAGWQGGAGTTTLVRALARHTGAVAVDATGAGPGLVGPGEERTPGVRWADLRVSEPSQHPDLVARLPLIGGGPALVADERGGATPADPRLAPVLHHLSHARDVVVDLGRWDGWGAALTGLAASGGGRAVRGVVDVVCLVGGGDDESAVRLAGAVGVWPPLCPLVVVHTRRSPSSLLAGAVAGAGGTGAGGQGVGGQGRGGGGGGGGGREHTGVVTWHFALRARGRGASRRLSLLWSRMRRLVPEERAGPGRAGRASGKGTGGEGTGGDTQGPARPGGVAGIGGEATRAVGGTAGGNGGRGVP